MTEPIDLFDVIKAYNQAKMKHQEKAIAFLGSELQTKHRNHYVKFSQLYRNTSDSVIINPFLNAFIYYKGIAHQKTAFEYLQKNTPAELLEKFAVSFRDDPEPPVQELPFNHVTEKLIFDSTENVTPETIQIYLPALLKSMPLYEINTKARICQFLSTLFVESGEFIYTEELASGHAYDDRTDLGNTPEIDGDGAFFKGHGLIQITGRANHQAYSTYVKDKTIMKNPKKLTQLPYSVDSACWFFKVNGCNEAADKSPTNIRPVTLIVNGGVNHLAERQEYLEKLLKNWN
jgi:predicted chitinase